MGGLSIRKQVNLEACLLTAKTSQQSLGNLFSEENRRLFERNDHKQS